MLLLVLNCGANAIVIKCSYELRKFYYCHGRVIDGGDTPEITEVLGAHVGNLTLQHVDSLRLVGQGLKVFPPNIHKIFPRTSKIDFGQNQITQVTNADINELRRLTELILSENRITELQSDLLRGMCYFKYLDVDNNQIEHVGYNFQFPERVGVPKTEPLEDWSVHKSPITSRDLYREKVFNEDFYDKMVLMDSRLSNLEKKLSNVIEYRIKKSENDQVSKEVEDEESYL
ncbi:hypothetical protein Bhyg_05665, partial [Pseudolycoriella hygida]